MKFVRPLYRCLMDTPAEGGRELAIGTFAANKESYHPICRKMVASDMEKAIKRSQEGAPSSSSSSSSSSDFYAGLGFGIGIAAVIFTVISAKQRA